MTVITIYALLADDIRLLVFPKAADDYFLYLTSLSMILFLFEIILASIGKKDYFNSFFFWLDLLSTLSLVTDIPFLMDILSG